MEIISIVAGLILLYFGGELLVTGAVNISKKLNISAIIIGMTVISLGTSAPELFVSITSGIHDAPGLAMGNIIGSNIVNILLGLGLTSVFYKIKFNFRATAREMYLMLFVTALIIIFIIISDLTYIHSIIFLTILVIHSYFLLKTAKQSPVEERELEEEFRQLNLINAILLSVIGLAMLSYGAQILVDGSIIIAKNIGVPETIIGLTIVAIGTSLPEIATCFIAAKRSHSDIIIGNIIGSNIYNILLIAGVASLINPLPSDTKLRLFDLPIMGILTLTIFLMMRQTHYMHRRSGIIFTAIFVIYIVLQYTLS